jgi:hypothetical protein
MRFSASGEVDAPVSPRQSQVVWRAPPRETFQAEPRRRRRGRFLVLWLGVAAAAVILAVALALALT